MHNNLRKTDVAQTPKETEQSVSDLASRLEEIDRAEGIFGENAGEILPDADLEEITGGMHPIYPSECPTYTSTKNPTSLR